MNRDTVQSAIKTRCMSQYCRVLVVCWPLPVILGFFHWKIWQLMKANPQALLIGATKNKLRLLSRCQRNRNEWLFKINIRIIMLSFNDWIQKEPTSDVSVTVELHSFLWKMFYKKIEAETPNWFNNVLRRLFLQILKRNREALLCRESSAIFRFELVNRRYQSIKAHIWTYDIGYCPLMYTDTIPRNMIRNTLRSF